MERVQRGIYALCKLVDWVKLEGFAKSALRSLGVDSRPLLRRRQNSPSKSEWWSNAAIDVHGADHITQLRVPQARLVRNVQLCMQRSPRELPPVNLEHDGKDPLSHHGSENLAQDCVVMDEQQSGDCGTLLPEQIYEMIKVQYQETLYISKVTKLLAFFQKILIAADFTGILCKGSFVTSPRSFLKPSRLVTNDFRSH